MQLLFWLYREAASVLCLFMLCAVGRLMVTSRALRGSYGRALPWVVDKSLRFIALGLWVAPILTQYVFKRRIDDECAVRAVSEGSTNVCHSELLIQPLDSGRLTVLTLIVLYAITFVDGSEKDGRRRCEWIRHLSFLWSYGKRYWSLRLVVDSPLSDASGEGFASVSLDRRQQYIVGVHPHGVIPLGTMHNLVTEISGIDESYFKGTRVYGLAASACFYVPLYRDLLLAIGVVDASRYNAEALLRRSDKPSLWVVPGGAEEALHAGEGKNTLVLKRRSGFIRLALRHGASLVPTYTFGENDCVPILDTVTRRRRAHKTGSSPSSRLWGLLFACQDAFQSIVGLTLPIVTTIVPRRVPVTTVLGRPIAVPKVVDPTEVDVLALQKVYMAALEDLFERHAALCIAEKAHRRLVIM